MKEIFVEIFTNMTVVKMVYIIGIYNLFMLAVLDSHQRKITKQKQQIESLEKQLIHLKKAEKVRDDFEQLWIHDIKHDIKSYNQETTRKMTSMEKKIKKIETIHKIEKELQ
jgi:heme/copper-type cytochrome/quinol oxidase subunit 1